VIVVRLETPYFAMNDIELNLLNILPDEDRTPEENSRLVRLMRVFLELPAPPDPLGLFPDYEKLRRDFEQTAEETDGDALEDAFLMLYCHVHGHEAPYTKEERRRVNQTGGYWCHAGGISPIIKAEPFIQAETVSADFGAGNGLQGLLLQKLYPHKKTIQIEISARMVEAGKHLQAWLGIPSDRVEWIVSDVCDVSPEKIDFIYIYRPLRPEGEGRAFYERFAETLNVQDRRVVIFSIADCLREFLPPKFDVFYTDGHLTCFDSGRDL